MQWQPFRSYFKRPHTKQLQDETTEPMFVYWLPCALFGSYPQNMIHTLHTFIRLAQPNCVIELEYVRWEEGVISQARVHLTPHPFLYYCLGIELQPDSQLFFFSLPIFVVASLYTVYSLCSLPRTPPCRTVHWLQLIYRICQLSLTCCLLLFSPVFFICIPIHRTEQSARMMTGVSGFLKYYKITFVITAP